MRIVVQLVKQASVSVDKNVISEIKKGYLILLGIENEDSQDDINWLAGKIAKLRIISDNNGLMNKSILESNGDIIVVSQFTLQAQIKKGNRPSYIKAARPEIASVLYDKFILQLENEIGKKIQTGKFGATMDVSLINEGPVTIFMDSKNKY
ncbi:MAG: D-aminoacyl-tRNA deacylase [Flavobacteriaceae bacterium]|nr:D-aminoacyl-tRNA deacylase [Flavobacteriaceae bacterium]MDG1790249.1 D-aminoacyl-tRNA deacylase [Flavobacteriaceae bacterium]MDG2447737.1 D-aminoacyl-tRNA deacylase [Flavobacteriaceae bacterium]